MASANDNTMRPVQVLSDLATRLEAAVLECIAKPKKKSVHAIRTTTRRIEAQLELLAMLPSLPPHQREAQKLRKLLKKLRRAAGHVRDLDVQRQLIRDEAGTNSSDRALRKESKHLRRELKRRRQHEAAKLAPLLRKDERKLPRAVASLEKALAPASQQRLPEARILALIRDWYRRHAEPHLVRAGSANPDELHAIRKVAKLARYLGEATPGSATSARRLAARFESLQQAGGDWHDWMQLAELAAAELGPEAALPQRFYQHAHSALSDYQRRLKVSARAG